MTDYFSDNSAGLTSPMEHGFAITPNDSADFSIYTRRLYVAGSGAVVADPVDGKTVTLVGALPDV
jgi:hypothetical protein